MDLFFSAFLITVVIFIICFIAMGIGMIIRGKKMQGGCGSKTDHKDGTAKCDFCNEKKKTNLCSSDNPSELVNVSKLGTMSRFESDKDK